MRYECPDFRDTTRLNRRSLLKVGAVGGMAGLSLPGLLKAASEAADGWRGSRGPSM